MRSTHTRRCRREDHSLDAQLSGHQRVPAARLQAAAPNFLINPTHQSLHALHIPN